MQWWNACLGCCIRGNLSCHVTRNFPSVIVLHVDLRATQSDMTSSFCVGHWMMKRKIETIIAYCLRRSFVGCYHLRLTHCQLVVQHIIGPFFKRSCLVSALDHFINSCIMLNKHVITLSPFHAHINSHAHPRINKDVVAHLPVYLFSSMVLLWLLPLS